MFEILAKKELAPNTFWFEAKAPLVAHARKAGQFMIICPHDKAERIPISLAGSNYENDSLLFVVQAIGKTTHEICSMNVGDSFYSIVGPLGEPSPIQKYGTVVCMGGGYGVAALRPICDELRQAGNRVIGVIGAREKNLILLEDFMKEACDEVRISTNDGSYGTQGFVTDVLQEILDEGIEVHHTFAIGPVPMMAAVSKMTQPLNIGCTVSLNALMVDGTSMCGGCRVHVNGESKFACCDGPDFDGHKVDFDELMNRQSWYQKEEKLAFAAFQGEEEHSPACIYQKDLDEIERFWNPNVPDFVELGEGLKTKDRMVIPRQKMPEQDPE
ncbi:MAG: sulfide/dihydroorotate dehydrogenase-like FAD/NAD-binding protein, partial [Candidatus Hinthialibacter sp.]